MSPRGARLRCVLALLSLFATLAESSPLFAHEDVEPPKLLDAPAAQWPAGKKSEHDLILPVVVTVGTDGSAEEVKLEASVGEPFDAIALETARRFKFEPARGPGGPRRAVIRVVVRFVGGSAEAPASPQTKPSPAVDARAAPVSAPPAKPAAPAPRAQAPDAPEAPRTTVIVRGIAPPRSASETNLERPVLSAAPHRTASDLLQVVPGVFVSQHSGEGKAHQIFFRGFDAVHGQDVEIWAAGAPVNDVSNIHGQGYADLHFLMPEVVRQIHAQPANFDPRQGDFAVAGSMGFDLGYDEPGLTAKAGIGNFGTRRYFLAYHPPDESPHSFGAFELYSTDGFGPSRAARRASAIGQVEHELSRRLTARVMASAYAGRFDSAGVVRLDEIENGTIDRFATYDAKQGGASARSQLVLELGHEHDDEKWSIMPYFVRRTLRLRSNFTGFLTSPEGDSFQQQNAATTFGAKAFYRRSVRLTSDRDALEAGIFLRNDSIEQSQHRLSLLDDRVTDDSVVPGVDATVTATDAAAYLDAELHPLRRLALRGGLRADGLFYLTEDRGGGSAGQSRASQGGMLSKRGTADFALLPGLRAVASYGEGFRSPQARSLAEGEATPFTRVVSYEAGFRYAERDWFQASLAAFRSELSDDLVFDQATARNEAVPATSRTGIAAILAARPHASFVSATSATYTRAVFEETNAKYGAGELLPYVPQLVVRSDIAFLPELGQVFGRQLRGHFGAGSTYLGRRPLPFGELGHDVFLVDASAALRLSEIELEVEVFNVLGAEWFDGEFVYPSNFSGGAAPSLVAARHVTVGPPRSVLFTLSLFV